MKRSNQEVRSSSSNSNRSNNNSNTWIVPILIELEDETTRNNKRPRSDNAPMNLLVRAMMEEKNNSNSTVNAYADVHNDNHAATGASTAASTIASSTASNSSTCNTTNSSARKQIIDRVLSYNRSLSPVSHDEDASSVAMSLSPLPNGRPLMAPPRLPTQLLPGQVSFLATNVMPLTKFTLLPLEVRYTKTTGRYRQTSVILPS